MRIVILILLFAGILLHAAGTQKWRMPANQRYLQQQSVAGLSSDDRFSGVAVEFQLLDGRVAGRVPSVEAREEVWAAIQNAKPAGRLFDHLEVVAPRDQPAQVIVSGSGVAPRLTGTVGEPSLKSALAAALAPISKGRPVQDELLVNDRVREPAWAASAEQLFRLFFERVPNGSLELQERQFVLRGRVKGEEERKALLSEIRAFLPEEGKLVSEIELQPDKPAELVAKRTGKSIRLSGLLPGANAGSNLAEALRIPGAEIENLIGTDPQVESPKWSGALPAFLTGYLAGGPGEVSLKGNRLTVKGDRPASKGRAPLNALLEPMRQAGCEISDQIRLVPDLEPELRASLTGGVLRLEGRLPDSGARERILEAGKAIGAGKLEDKMTVQPAVKPAAWLDAVPGILGMLFRNRSGGELALNGTTWRVQGETENAISREALLASITSLLPKGITLDSSQFRLAAIPLPPADPDPASMPPLVATPIPMGPASPAEVKPTVNPWVVVQFGPAGQRIEGQLPDEADRKALRSALPTPASGALRQDELQVSKDVGKAPWMEPVSAFLPKFASRVPDGSLEVRNGKLTLSGAAPDPRTRDALLAGLASALPNDLLKVEDRMTVKQSGTEAENGRPFVIYFNANSDWIRPDGRLEIDKASELLRTLAPGATVLVKGFADSRGDPTGNLRLSELRAEAVRDSLVLRGVAKEQLELIGVGEKEARKGSSDEVWSKDRRVEIIAVGN